MDCKRVFLSENEIPTAWYNLQADLPKPLPPPLHPGTMQPITPADLMARLLESVAGTSKNGQRVKLSERVYLTLREASEYSGLPQSWLVDKIRHGGIKAIFMNGVGYRIKRKDLEAL